MTAPAAAMVNLLGDLWFSGDAPEPVEPNWAAALTDPAATLHLYGKSEPRQGRKMGHLTVTAATADTAESLARTLRTSLDQLTDDSQTSASGQHGAGDLLDELRADHRRHVDEIAGRVELDHVGTDERPGQRIDHVEHLADRQSAGLVVADARRARRVESVEVDTEVDRPDAVSAGSNRSSWRGVSIVTFHRAAWST